MRVACLIAAALAGCSDTSRPVAPETPVTPPACAADEVRCGTEQRVEVCRDGQWQIADTCPETVPADLCVPDTLGVPRCAAIASEGKPCVGTEARSSCSHGLVCADIALPVSTPSRAPACPGGFCCATACTHDQDCGEGRFCSSATLPNGARFASTRFCAPKAARNQHCLFEDAACVGDLHCVPVAGGASHECKRLCENPGGPSPECGPDELCFEVRVPDETSLGVTRLCNPGGPPCPGDFECTMFSLPAGDLDYACTRPVGVCGTAADILSQPLLSFEDTDYLLEHIACETVATDLYCQEGSVGDASVECTATGFYFYWEGSSCAAAGDFDGCFGRGQCIESDTGEGHCGGMVRTCVPFCTSSDGTTELDCGEGYRCVEQSETELGSFGAVFIQWDDGFAASCNELLGGPDNCDASRGFGCDCRFINGCFCVKWRKVCVPD